MQGSFASLYWFCLLAITYPQLCIGLKLVVTNDDGWAVAQIRAEFNALEAAGFDVVLSAPAINMSGSGSSSAPPTPLVEPCEFDTCPAGSPPEGSDPNDVRINYVNSYPVDAVHYGVQTLAPRFFDSPPDLVVSGANIGHNVGTNIADSGTVNAACHAAHQGIPSIAFSGSGKNGAQVSYTTLTSDPDSLATRTALIYSSLVVLFIDHLLSGPHSPIVPPGTILNINLASTKHCQTAGDFAFILTRIASADDDTPPDIETCGSTKLPTDFTVIQQGCFVTVSVVNATTMADVDASFQGLVLEQLDSLLTCIDSD
ncbi:hypothetical protein AMATHDRAFT_75649 [Amanita thiersii Skay4041]|uniref:Survival protein SurE-like phosphatase/nucleotidase domain-containing protein n=1 Tax=Amanita thiersii Skay4041 TaxID=703135 RepID=A0A2A9NHA4_9AGAR|nr:hypothetical protein AMATHDRAFT_75649 [Amanita thiersii Skay4041]